MAEYLPEAWRWPVVDGWGQSAPKPGARMEHEPVFAYHHRGGVFLVYPDHVVVAEWQQHRLRVTRLPLSEVVAVTLYGFPRRLNIRLRTGRQYVIRLDRRATAQARTALQRILSDAPPRAE